MEYIAAGQLVVILILVWLLNRSRDHEVQAILDVNAANDAERAELLNRIQRPEYIRPVAGPSQPREVSETERKHLENLAKIGKVEA